MTKQKIGDGDLLGFDASTVEAERPEVREPQKPRQPRGAKPEGERHGGGRKDKGKDSGRDNNRSKPQGGRSQQPRGASSAAPPRQPCPHSLRTARRTSSATMKSIISATVPTM